MSHLTPAQLAALRDGELDAPELTQHLADCAECRVKLAEARRLAAALRSAASDTLQEHPSDLILAAYIENTLSGRERIRIADHILSCPQCSAILKVIRQAVDASE